MTAATRPSQVLAIVCAGIVLANLDLFIVNVALPEIARDFGGAEKDANVTSAIASWSQVSIPGIVVSGGSATIGAETTAGANQWVDLDDVTLVKN